MNNLIAFDPGGHTGLVKYNRRIQDITYHTSIPDEYKIIYLELNGIDNENTTILIENVHGALRNRDKIEMCKKVGFIEGLCATNGYHYKLQSPTIKTGFMDISRKWFKENHKIYMEHEIDAFAHILYYLSKREGIDKFR